MKASELLERSIDAEAWRKQSRALRRSAAALWNSFSDSIISEVRDSIAEGRALNLDMAAGYLETCKLLFGLTLETALKALIIEHQPEKIEVRSNIDGSGNIVSAELRTIGLATSQSHNLLTLAEVAGLFDGTIPDVFNSDFDKQAFRDICRNLGEAVSWRGRYPVPLTSFEPLTYNPKVPTLALGHYLLDFLDPVLDRLLGPCEVEVLPNITGSIQLEEPTIPV